MKKNIVRKLGLAVAFAFFAGVLPWGSTTANAQRGAAEPMQGRPIKSSEDVNALHAGDVAAMACPKCKTISFSRIEEGRGANKPLKVGAKHMCPGCKTTIETVGVGKGAKDEIKHVCQKCGSELAYCCSFKKDEITKGMEEPAGAETPESQQPQK